MRWINLKKKMMQKRSFTKSTWYDWLSNYITEPIKKQWVVLQAKLRT